ncbi:TetR family transcriptional regulator [Thermogemmatispora carboxidivorans]|uniref:TetR family transcriptional regulator n=1 Tax=Thermogemmatispora carboxidivorans TaxID=1382306 RepID=UPI000699B1BA|nr:TetR family transcriptional regulator [Thermogemmatispora carboxidivorans]
MRRTREAAAQTREQLLRAALSCFLEHGYAATTLDEVARRAGTTRGAIQWHFGSKADLFNTLVREQYERAARKLLPLYRRDGAPLETLRAILLAWLSYPEEDADFRAMLELTTLRTGMLPELQSGIEEKVQAVEASIAHFAALLRRAREAGEIRAEVVPEQAATAAYSLIVGLSSLWLLNPSAFSLRAYATEAVEIFIRGLRRS